MMTDQVSRFASQPETASKWTINPLDADAGVLQEAEENQFWGVVAYGRGVDGGKW
jgi:hypothetical protein